MRTKTLLLTAALGLLGAASSFAQVYSVNAVGYVNQTWANAGYLLIENPLNNGDNKIGTVLPVAPEGSTLQSWNADLQDFNETSIFLTDAWYAGLDFHASTEVIPPGAGFLLYAADATTITFVGDVPQGDNLTVTLKSGYNMVGSIVPQSADFTVLGLNAVAGEGDTVQFWNFAEQTYFTALSHLGTDWYLPPNFDLVVPTPAVGEAFFYYRADAGPIDWTRSFHVNP